MISVILTRLVLPLQIHSSQRNRQLQNYHTWQWMRYNHWATMLSSSLLLRQRCKHIVYQRMRNADTYCL